MRSAQRWRWTHTYGVQLLVASIVAVVLAGAGLVAVLVLDRDADTDSNLTGPACVPGRWRIIEQRQELSSSIWTLVGDGPVVAYRGDGTATIDYGDGVTYTVTDILFGGLGNTDAVITGAVHHEYQAQSDTMHYFNIRSEATVPVEGLGDLPWEIDNAPFGYECRGEIMTHRIDDRYLARFRRLES